jgi:hypothetical protein
LLSCLCGSRLSSHSLALVLDLANYFPLKYCSLKLLFQQLLHINPILLKCLDYVSDVKEAAHPLSHGLGDLQGHEQLLLVVLGAQVAQHASFPDVLVDFVEGLDGVDDHEDYVEGKDYSYDTQNDVGVKVLVLFGQVLCENVGHRKSHTGERLIHYVLEVQHLCVEGQGENDENDKSKSFHNTESHLEQGVVFQKYKDHDIDQPTEEEQGGEELVDRPILLNDRFSIELSDAATCLHGI